MFSLLPVYPPLIHKLSNNSADIADRITALGNLMQPNNSLVTPTTKTLARSHSTQPGSQRNNSTTAEPNTVFHPSPASEHNRPPFATHDLPSQNRPSRSLSHNRPSLSSSPPKTPINTINSNNKNETYNSQHKELHRNCDTVIIGDTTCRTITSK